MSTIKNISYFYDGYFKIINTFAQIYMRFGQIAYKFY